MSFKPGDVVSLKPGYGPRMTVRKRGSGRRAVAPVTVARDGTPHPPPDTLKNAYPSSTCAIGRAKLRQNS
jgi:hypothetical protein